jgi:hypothetical protein
MRHVAEVLAGMADEPALGEPCRLIGVPFAKPDRRRCTIPRCASRSAG